MLTPFLAEFSNGAEGATSATRRGRLGTKVEAAGRLTKHDDLATLVDFCDHCEIDDAVVARQGLAVWPRRPDTPRARLSPPYGLPSATTSIDGLRGCRLIPSPLRLALTMAEVAKPRVGALTTTMRESDDKISARRQGLRR